MIYPKPRRIKDPELIERVRAYGKCMWGGDCYGGLDIHHIKTRGSGGGDVEGNLILLCRKHHQLAHTGKISKEELREVAYGS